MPSDTKMQELLTALTEAVIAEDNNLDAIVDYYEDIPRKEANSLLHVIRRLHKTFVVVQPSPAFSRRLKQDLIGVPGKNLIWRWRSLPARVQLAAGFALLGGFALILGRRFSFLEALRERDVEEATVARG
jgi:hypothetical protein